MLGSQAYPPQFGLYTLVASLSVYALFGTSRHLSVGATSATAALIASTVIALGATTVDMDNLPGICHCPGTGDRCDIPGGRIGTPGLGHAVFVKTGHGWLRDGISDLCSRWAAQ